jgi:hypothetical protein
MWTFGLLALGPICCFASWQQINDFDHPKSSRKRLPIVPLHVDDQLYIGYDETPEKATNY